MDNQLEPLILSMENAEGLEVEMNIDPEDDFQVFLDKAKALLGYEVDITSITQDQPVLLTDNIYQYLLNSEYNKPSNDSSDYRQMLSQSQNFRADDMPSFDQIMAQDNNDNDLEYILNDGTQIRASQIHFDNEDLLTDLTNEKLPFVKYTEDVDEIDFENLNIHETRNINIVESPVSKWTIENSSPSRSFINTLPFKLICNNINGFEAQFTKYLEANCNKTYTTLNPVKTADKSPKSLIKDNFKNYDDISHTREQILNMFKDSPMTSVPYDQGYTERRHVRKSDPSKLVHKSWNKPALPYIDIDGVLIGHSQSQICFICGKHVDNNIDKLYLFDKEDQRVMKCSPQKKVPTQLKIICETCLSEHFKPCRMKSANQFLNQEEYLVIRNNHQYIFQKVKNFIPYKAREIIKKVESKVNDKDEFVKVEIGSDGEIVTRPVDNDPPSDDVIIVNDSKKNGNSSDVEIIEPEPEIDKIIDNLEDADEEVKEFLGKYQCDSEVTELKCRFCEKVFAALTDVLEHCDTHKHDMDDGVVFPCPLCNYGYANSKWLKGHLKAAHESSKIKDNSQDCELKEIKEEPMKESSPIAKRTRSSNKKSDEDKKEEENKKGLESADTPNLTEHFIIKTEVKQEALDSSEDEIWILQTMDHDAQELNHLIDTKENDPPKEPVRKGNKCFSCSIILPSAEALASHQCRKRGRKRKTKEDNTVRKTTAEDFFKRHKKRRGEPSSDPQIVTCHNCDQSFTSKVRLKFHMQFHESTNMLNAEGQYSCTECDETTFPTETELFDHVHFQHDKQKRWQCPVDGCGKTFFLRATLTKHSRTHTDTRRYVCVTCGKRFLDKQTLDEHGVTHLQIKPFQCHICLKQLTRRSRLRMHVRAHEEELAPRRVCACAVCGRAFRDVQQAQEHATKSKECIEVFASELKQEDDGGAMQLSPTSGVVREIDKTVESPKLSKPIEREVSSEESEAMLSQLPDEARLLIRVVEIEKAFRCEYCEDVFYIESGLNTHRVIHKGIKNPFTCHICKVSFATYSRCTTHKTTHGFYKRSVTDSKTQDANSQTAAGILGYGDFPVVKHFLCEECGRSYLHWTYLQVHRRMKHANDNYLYKCNQCTLTFRNSWSLAYHRKKVHGKVGADDTGPTKVVREDYRIPCRDCDEVLPNKTALYRHRKKEHTDVSIQSPKQGEHVTAEGGACPHCHATFTFDEDLQKHIKSSHSISRLGEHSRTFACSECGHMFRTQSARAEHLRTHTGERPFPCDVCGVAFRRSTAMRNHRLIHTGVRAWACGRCPKRFRIRSDLKTHLKLKHPATVVVLEMLGLNPSSEEVMKHLAMTNLPRDKIIEVTKISFAKGTTSVIPSSARGLASLSNVPFSSVACKPQPTTAILEDLPPVRRGRGIAKAPRRPVILQRGEVQHSSTYPLARNGVEEDLSDIQLLLRDGVLVNGNEMVHLDDSMLLD